MEPEKTVEAAMRESVAAEKTKEKKKKSMLVRRK
jgi:hypothetical protein